MSQPRFLGVLLCYNDGDLLADSITHLLNNRHDLVVWNHGSTDETGSVLERFRGDLLELTDVPRSVDFYDLYPLMSKHLLNRYVSAYDWISWPDQDEFLEGPSRGGSYAEFLAEAVDSKYSWVEFNDYTYWYTERDDAAVASPCARIKYYSRVVRSVPKIRCWRASSTNIRWFNHNPAAGKRHPARFNLRHYPMRSEAQMQRRLAVDRAHIRRGTMNYHYENAKVNLPALNITADKLHWDDEVSDLNPGGKFDWARVFGAPPALPARVAQAYVLSSKRWELSEDLKRSLLTMQHQLHEAGSDPAARWLEVLDRQGTEAIGINLDRAGAEIVTEDLAREWEKNPDSVIAAFTIGPTCCVEAKCGAVRVSVTADVSARSVRVQALDPVPGLDGDDPLIALLPVSSNEDATRLVRLTAGKAEFRDLSATHYYLAIEQRASDASKAAPVLTTCAA